MQPGSASNTPDATIILLPIAIIVIPIVCLTLPSILVARSYNKSLKKKPMETEIDILRVIFWKTDNEEQSSSGTYFYRIETGDYIETRKMSDTEIDINLTAKYECNWKRPALGLLALWAISTRGGQSFVPNSKLNFHLSIRIGLNPFYQCV